MWTDARQRSRVRAACPGRVGEFPTTVVGIDELLGVQPSPMLAEPVLDRLADGRGDVWAFARAAGAKLHHVKCHGALYNMASEDPALARAIAEAIKAIDPALILYALADSELLRAGAQAGLRVASEVFADRTYQSDGSLTPRTQPDALIEDTGTALAQVRRMVGQGLVRSIQGIDVPITADTLCIHGDRPGAVRLARKIRAALDADGVRVAPIGR